MINAYYFYLLAHKLYKWKIPFLPKVIKFFIFIFYNSSIPFECVIGKGTRFAYGGISTIIHKECVLKENINIGSSVVLGGKVGIKGVPSIESNVYIGTGAKILGPIKVGENSVIGANAVVVKDVPPNVVVAGVPAVIIKNLNI